MSELPVAGVERDGFIRSFARGLAVLRAFQPPRPRMTITQVANVCGLTRAGARRMLLTLHELGYVGMDGREFYLTGRVFDLSQGFLAQPLWKAVRAALQSVAAELGETASSGVLEGFNVVYTLRVKSPRMVHLQRNPGDQVPAHLSSMGRVLLSALPQGQLEAYLRQAQFNIYTRFTVKSAAELRTLLEETREQGWSCARGEMDESITGISVPLMTLERRTIAAINVSMNTERASTRMVEGTVVPTLKEAADSVLKALRAG